MNGPVICGIDESSGAAADVAASLARRHGLSLLTVHVLDGSDVRGLRPDIVIEGGHPADRLVEIARERRASFIVVGNGGPRSSLLGSVSADVARRAPCPVVVVPTTVQTAAGAELAGGVARLA